MRLEHPLAGFERAARVAPRRRLELLEEMDADARDLERELKSRGRPQARNAALRRLLPSDDVVRELEDANAPPLGRWIRESGWLERLERFGLAAVALVAGAAAFVTLPSAGLPGPARGLVWVQAIVFSLLAVNWAQVAGRLWVAGDLRPARRDALWRRHVGLMVTAVAVGAFGSAWQGYASLELQELDVATLPSILGALTGSMAFGAFGLASATFGLFGWLSVTPRLITDEAIEERIATFFSRSQLGLVATRPEEDRPSDLEHQP